MTRQTDLERLQSSPWDVVIIGGGITGAGFFLEASRQGLRCLLLEQKDFAWGTSSRSGKMVHGGLRYLKQGQFKTSWQAVRERERLLVEYPGLVTPLPFIFPVKEGRTATKLAVHLFISLYDLMAGRQDHQYHPPAALGSLLPFLGDGKSFGGFGFQDAVTDDARLVYRTIQEGQQLGGLALNYVKVLDLLKDQKSHVAGVAARDETTGNTHEVQARVVVNAGGAWNDELRKRLGRSPRLRRLRGSHLVFTQARFPLPAAIALTSPRDHRSLYALPWEGMTLLGTTDLDHALSLDQEPKISRSEGDYLLEAADQWFPGLRLSAGDVVATFSGVRPVINTGKKNPSRESREHAIWIEEGLISISGGKLTTFQLMARQALSAARSALNPLPSKSREDSFSPGVPGEDVLNSPAVELKSAPITRLIGRYGPAAAEILAGFSGLPLETVEGTRTLWAEVTRAAQEEKVVHLDDLLLRRTRLGLLLPRGGADLMDRVREHSQASLQWDDRRWLTEVDRYLSLWHEAYSPDLIA
jgi:glycerol-3-phosphate dehydrogenase